ncbi:MAG: DUF502 domain-containing protein, partial [Gemmatimonadales bacterium]|nr:DUF502 domain-containing protein [Gemmatimonadales bacterium]
MKRLAQYFLRGLLITTPVALTLWICWWLVSTVDSFLPLGFPGAGILVTIAGITIIGALAGTLATRAVLGEVDRLLEGLPFVRLVYTWTKDLLNAFVGEKRRFNRPVRLRLDLDSDVWHVGFVTADALDHLGLPGHVAVYLPWSYSFAGRVILVPSDRVEPIQANSTD